MNEVRQATPEEEAVMNMELFKTEELFNKRVQEAVTKLLAYDGHIQQQIESIAQRRISAFRDNLANTIASAVRNTY